MIEDEVRENVLKLIDEEQDSIVEFLQKLIKLPSIPGKEKECAELCARKLRDMEIEVDAWEPDLEQMRRCRGFNPSKLGYKNRPNVVGVLKGKGGGRSLLLNGHIDVVPPGPMELWKHNPWGGEIDGGKIYGRGAMDMKGGVTAMIKALECIQKVGLRLKGDVVTECVIDEEYGGNGTLACILRGYRADAGIITEASGIRNIVVGHRGSLCFQITTLGQAAPVHERGRGVNAIEKMTKIFNGLKDLQAARLASLPKPPPLYKRYPNYAPVYVGTIQGGDWFSTTPLKCTIEGVIGWLPNENLEDMKEFVEAYLRHIASEDPWLAENPPEVKFTCVIEPCEVERDHLIIQTVKTQAKEVSGEEPVLTVSNAGADQRLLILNGKTPTVQYGPGGGNAHGIDEYISVEELINCTKILALTILNWCGCAPQRSGEGS